MECYIEDTNKELKKKYLIKVDRENGPIYRYDWKERIWVEDNYMLKIFTGDIEVVFITEEEVKKLISIE